MAAAWPAGMRHTKLNVAPLEAGRCWLSKPVHVPKSGWAALSVCADVPGELEWEWSLDEGATWQHMQRTVPLGPWDPGTVRLNNPNGLDLMFRARFRNGPKPQDFLEVVVRVAETPSD